jgi:predicted transcriptional regulator
VSSFSSAALSDLSPNDQKRVRAIGIYFGDQRQKAQLGLQELAQALSVEVETIIAYETGAKPIPLDDVFALTNTLNLAPEDVLSLVSDLYIKTRS